MKQKEGPNKTNMKNRKKGKIVKMEKGMKNHEKWKNGKETSKGYHPRRRKRKRKNMKAKSTLNGPHLKPCAPKAQKSNIHKRKSFFLQWEFLDLFLLGFGVCSDDWKKEKKKNEDEKHEKKEKERK